MNTHTSIKRRDVLRSSLYAGTAMALPIWSRAEGSNSDIRVAVIGFNGRGKGHIGSLAKIKGVRLVALCDVDSGVLDKEIADQKKKGNTDIKAYTDYRKLVEDKDIDAVTIATPNHTHTLIAMTAIAAGKHVYVEKPTNHNLWEGSELVKAAAKVEGKQIVQHGMQRRSDLGWAAAQEYIKSGALGKTLLSRGVNYKARQSIGKVSEGKSAGADGTFAAGTFKDTKGTVDYNLWAGPREMSPINREKFHYDWHWQWAYGNGDIGNQGPHQLDVARWMIGNPEKLPVRVMSFGNRWGYVDDGQTANNQMALYDYGKGNVPILFDNRGLPRKDMDWTKGNEPVFKQVVRIGNVVHCEGGYVAESKAYDNEGKWNGTKFTIQDGPEHMANFISSIRAGKLINPNLHVSHGFQAASLAILSNISYRLGKKVSPAEVKERLSGDKFATETFEDFAANLQANKIDIGVDQVALGPWLSFNPDSLKFEGEFAEEANKLATDEYRKEFELPKIG
ncbi:Gfo/Idh/MocA family oxidoreductase [Roseimicrobium sp. ORNL1]|uniref:Gfo/Idh/MocA family protein n=1 Tax=Roseimicrobium sp. ORNL1 TaxID=2711231 RepID=UPI0013E11758|nr:Gfo/Idh/MocA family oxidoreductase [Roseimicrobium sp. ORNL1]QIF04295.1 Gfo/Idh/MocA family oxidoreductase [Roseimicrobium sp. ORNL1]